MTRHELNARGLLCPMPVIRLQQKINQLGQGDILTIYCTDPGTQYDIPAWCRVHGHRLLSIEQRQAELEISIQVEEPS